MDGDIARDLQEWLEAGDGLPMGDDGDGLEEGWLPGSEVEVEKLLARMRRARAEAARIEALAEAEIDRITAWAADRAAGPKRRAAECERVLEGWARQGYPEGQGRTLMFPSGTLRLTAPRERLVVTDEEKLVGWCREHAPSALKVQPSVAGLKERLKPYAAGVREGGVDRWVLADPDTGEVDVPGVVLEKPCAATFKVTPAP